MPPAARRVDRELRAYLALTRRLPYVKGAGAVANVAKRVYARKPRAEVETDVLGFRMRLEPDQVVDRDVLFAPQLYDRPQVDYLRAHVRPGDDVVDLGANIGIYSLIASRCVGPEGRVIAVEADPYNHAKLARNLELSGVKNVVALNVGVSDEDGTLPFVPGAEGNRGGGSFASSAPSTLVVETRRLLRILDETGVRRPRGVKMDIELFEHRVMKRFFAEAPRERWPGFLIVERHWDPELMRRAGGDIVRLCEEHGYAVEFGRNGEFVLSLRDNV